MKEKCPFYQKTCSNPDKCAFQVWHFQKKECRKGGLLKTPKKLEWIQNAFDYTQEQERVNTDVK